MMMRSAFIGCLCLLSLNVWAQGDFIEELPKAGEGVYTFLERHAVQARYKDEFIKLNSGKFGPKEALLLGFKYKIDRRWTTEPPEEVEEVGEWRDYEIFGEEYRKVKIEDQSLQGAIFYLVSGHGGPDPGAVGERDGHQLCEDEYAYDVTVRLARWLIARGALVYLITRDDDDGIRDDRYLKCDKDEYAYLRGEIPARHLPRLKQRTGVVNEVSRKYGSSQYQRMLSIHVDSRSRGEEVDVFFYYHHRSESGKAMAQDVYETIETNYKTYQPNRGYRGSVLPSNSWYVLRASRPPAILIEIGNISSERDRRRIMIPENRQALAKWIGEGLIKNYNASR